MLAKIVRETIFSFDMHDGDYDDLILLEGEYNLAIYVNDNSINIRRHFDLKKCAAYQILGEIELPDSLLQAVLNYLDADAKLYGYHATFQLLINSVTKKQEEE